MIGFRPYNEHTNPSRPYNEHSSGIRNHLGKTSRGLVLAFPVQTIPARAKRTDRPDAGPVQYGHKPRRHSAHRVQLLSRRPKPIIF